MISKLWLSLALITPALAQVDATNVTQVVAGLSGLGLTTLAQLALSLNGTASGNRLLNAFSSGNQLVFAPSNDALSTVPESVSSNKTLLADIISYHIVQGDFSSPGSTATFPNVTVARTILNDPTIVKLEGNFSQAIAWQNGTDGKVHVLNQDPPVTVQNSSTFGNVTIFEIDTVISLPPTTIEALDKYNLTAVKAAVVGTNATMESAELRGFTFFAPTDAAFAAVQDQLNKITNVTILAIILGNHVLESQTVYSPQLVSAFTSGNKFTSSAGEPISGAWNSSGLFVTSGDSTAKVVTSDIIVQNGVIHIIDTVLLNNMTDAAAASSAVASATSAAGQATGTQTGPITGAPGATGTGTSRPSSAASPLGVQVGSALVAAFVGVLFAL